MASSSRDRRAARAGCAAASIFIAASGAAYADFEEVRILRSEPIQVQICPAAGQAAYTPPAPAAVAAGAPAGAPAGQPANPASPGFTGKEVLGGVAGAAVGGLIGNQIGSGSGRTAATVAGAGLGAYAGYKLAGEKPQQPPAQQPPPGYPAQQPPPVYAAQPACTLATHYRIYYARPNGAQGDVLMSTPPIGASLLINFCGDRPCQ